MAKSKDKNYVSPYEGRDFSGYTDEDYAREFDARRAGQQAYQNTVVNGQNNGSALKPGGDTVNNSVLGTFKDSIDKALYDVVGGVARFGANQIDPGARDGILNGIADWAEERSAYNTEDPQQLTGAKWWANAVGNAIGSSAPTAIIFAAMSALGPAAGGLSALAGGVANGAKLANLISKGKTLGTFAQAAKAGANLVSKGAGAVASGDRALREAALIRKFWTSPFGKFAIADQLGNIPESMSEAGNLITQLRQDPENYTDEEIATAAWKSFGGNMAWLSTTDALQQHVLGKMMGKPVQNATAETVKEILTKNGINFTKEGMKQLGKQTGKVAAFNAFQEGLEEFGQGYIENKAAGQDFNVEDAIEAAKMGAAGGLFLGAGGNILNSRFDKSKHFKLNGREYEISNPDSEGRVHTKIDGDEVSHKEFFSKFGGMVEGGLTARNFGDNGFVDARDIKTERDVDNYIADMNERLQYYGGAGTFQNADEIVDYIQQATQATGDSKIAIGRKLVEATNNGIRGILVRHNAKVKADNEAKVREDIAANAKAQREEVVAAEQEKITPTVSDLETAQNVNDTNTKISFGPGAVGAAATTAQVQNATDAANKILSDVVNSANRTEQNRKNNIQIASDKTSSVLRGLANGINTHPQDFTTIDSIDEELNRGYGLFDVNDVQGREKYDAAIFNDDNFVKAYSHGTQRSWEHNSKAATTQEELDNAKKKYDARMAKLEKNSAGRLDGKTHLAQKLSVEKFYKEKSDEFKNPDAANIKRVTSLLEEAAKKGAKSLSLSRASLLKSKKNQSPAVQKAIEDKYIELGGKTKNETKDNKPIQGSDTLSKQAEPKEDGDKGASKENKGSDDPEGKVKRDENTPRKMVGDNIRVALDVAKHHTDDVLKGLKSHKRDIKVNENVKVDNSGNEVSTNIEETAVSEFQKVCKDYNNMPAEERTDAVREKTLKHLWDLVSKMGDTNDKIRYAAKAAEISRHWQTAKEAVERIDKAVENLRSAKGSIDGLRKEISKVLGEDVTDGTTNLTNEEKDNILASWKEKVKAVGIDMCSTPEEFLAKKADIIEDTKDSELYKVTDIENSNGRIYIHYEENGVAKQDEITQDMGWTLPGSKVIYINKNTMDASTPIHEYVHVWAYVIKQNNPELWNKIKDVMKRTGMYDLVQEVGQYGKLSEDVVVEEALAFTTGYHWATIEKAINDKEKSSLWLRAVKGFWNAVKELLGFSTNRKNAVDNDVFDLMQMPIASLLNKDTGVGISEREAMQQTADIAARLSFGEIKADEAYESVEKIKENMVKAGLADPALITKLQKKMYAQLQTAQILAQEADDITESYIEPVIDALVKAESILATNTSTTLEKFVPEKIYANNKKKSIGLKRADKVGWYSANNAFADLFKDGILNRKKLATYRGDVFDNVQNSPYFNKLWGILASRAIDKFEAALNNHKQGEEFKKSSATHAKTDILNRMQLIKTQAKRTFDKGYMPPRNNSVVQKKASGSYVMPSSVIREKVGAEDFNKLFAEDITQEEFNKIFDKVEDKGDKPKLMSARKQGSLATSKEHFGGVDVAADTLLQVEDEYGDGNLDVADLMNSKMTVKGSKFIEHTVRVPNLSTTYKISNAMRLYSRAIYRGATFIAQNPTATPGMMKEYIESDNFEYGDSVMEVALSLRNLPTISNLDNARLQDFALFLGNVIAKCEKHFSGVEMYLGDVEPTVREYLFGNAGTVSRSLLDYFGADSYEVYDTGFQPLHGDNKIIAFSKGGIGSEVKYSYLEKQTQDRFGNSYYYNVLENPRFGELANQSYNGYSLKQAIAPAWNGLSEEDKIQMLDDTVKAVANVLVFNDLNVDSRMFEKENFDLFAKKDTGAIDKLPKRIEECVKYIKTGNVEASNPLEQAQKQADLDRLIDALKRAKLLSEDNKIIKSGWGQSVDEVAQDFDIQLGDMIKTSLQKDGYIEVLVNALNDLREGNFAAADIDWNNEVYDRQEQDAADQDLQDTNDELRRIQENDDAEEATYYEDDVEVQDDTEVEEEGTRSKSFRNDELEPEQSDKEAVEKAVEKAEKASPFEDNKNTSLIKSILDLEVAFMYRLTLTDKTPRLDAAKMIRGLLMKKTNEYIQTWSNAQEAGKLIQAEAANFEKAKAEIEKNISLQVLKAMHNAPNRREFRPSWFARLLAGRATGYTVDGTHVVFRGPQLRNDEVKTIDDRVKSVLEDVGVRVIQDNLSEKLAKTNIDNTVKKWADSLGDAEAITKAKALADVSENHKANRTSLINAIVQAQDNIMEFATHNERCYTKVYKNQDDSYSTEWREVEPQLYSLAKYVYEKKTGKKVKVQERFLKDNAVTKIARTYGCSEEVAKLAYNIALNEHLPRPYRLTIKGVDKETLPQANNIADSIYNNIPRNYAEQNRSFEELRSLANNNLEAMAATLLMNRMKRAETTANFAIKSVRARLNSVENKLVHAKIEHDAFTTWALYLNDLRTDNTGTQESVVNIQKAVDNLRSKHKEDENAFTALTEEIFGVNIRNILTEQLGIYNQGEGPVSSNRDARHNNQAVDEQRHVSTVMRERLAGSISVPGRRTVDGRAQGSNQAGISGQSNIQPSTRLEPARGVEARSTNLVGGKTDYRWRKRNVNGSVEGGKGNEGQGTRIRPLEGSTNNRREGVGGPQANRNLYAQVSREEGLEGTSHILSVLDYINGLYVADDKKRSRDNKNANDEYFSARKILVVTSSPEESQRWSQLAQQRYGNAINEYGNDFDGVGVATITFDALSKENGGNERWDNVVVADPNFINNAEYYDKVSRLVGYIQDDGLDTYAELSRYVAEQGDKILTTAMGKDYLNTMVELERYLKTVEDRVKSDKTVLDDVTYDNEVGQKLRQTLQNINKVEVSDKARKTIHGLFISHYLAKVKEGRKNAWNTNNALHTERIFVSMAEPMKETGEINNTVATPNGFRGEFSYLSNMHPSPITIDGKTYNSVENYFQAMKSTDTNTQQKIATASPVNARKFGRQIELREDWDNIKDDVMENAVKAKFQQHPELMSKLNTVQGEIVEYNDWGDRYWGKDKVTQIGDNKLGKILMSIRGEKTNDKVYTVAITGHRPQKLPEKSFRYDTPFASAVIDRMQKEIEQLAKEHGKVRIVSGAALGIDQYWAIAAMRAKKNGANVILHMANVKGQDAKWGEGNKKTYAELLRQADEVHETPSTPGTHVKALDDRNKYMADMADEVIAWYDGSKGGTGNMVEHTKSIGKPLKVINPQEFNNNHDIAYQVVTPAATAQVKNNEQNRDIKLGTGQYRMTPTDYQKAEQDLKSLQDKLAKVTQAKKEAAALGDLSENAEYTSAKAEIARLTPKVAALKKRLDNATIINPANVSNTELGVGTKFWLRDVNDDSIKLFEMVASDGDIFNGTISIQSPVGNLLYKAHKGDAFIWNDYEYKVVSFEGVDTSGVSVQQAWEDLQKRNAAMKKVVNNPSNYYEKLPYEIPYHTPAFVRGLDDVVTLYTKIGKAQKALDDNTDKRSRQEKQEALATLQNKLVDLLNSVDKAERSLMLDRLANSLGVMAEKNVPRRMSTFNNNLDEWRKIAYNNTKGDDDNEQGMDNPEPSKRQGEALELQDGRRTTSISLDGRHGGRGQRTHSTANETGGRPQDGLGYRVRLGGANLVEDDVEQRVNHNREKNGLAPLKFKKKVTPKEFAEAMQLFISHKDNPMNKNMDAVDIKTEEDLNGSNLFLLEDINAGFAIKPDGDIVAVFKDFGTIPNRRIYRNLATDMMLIAKANGGLKMDCYGQQLANMYEAAGFVVVNSVEFNGDYTNSPFLLRTQPTVYTLMVNSDSAEESVRKFESGEARFRVSENLSHVKVYGKNEYDKAIQERDDLLYKKISSNSAPRRMSLGSREIETEYNEIKNKYFGTNKWLKAPNGNSSNLSPELWCLVRTPNFKRWFGDWENDPQNASKVVDENGEPKVVYHGTATGGFEAFYDDRPIFFADNKLATEYFNRNFGDSLAHLVAYVASKFYKNWVIHTDKEMVEYINSDFQSLWDDDSDIVYKIVDDRIMKKDDEGTWNEVTRDELIEDFTGHYFYSAEDYNEMGDLNAEQYIEDYDKRAKTDLSLPKIGDEDEYFPEYFEKRIGRKLQPETFAMFLNIRNPKVIEAQGSNYGFDREDVVVLNGRKDSVGGSAEWTARCVKKEEPEFDGVIFKNIREGDVMGPDDEPGVLTNDYIVFKNTQVKSVDNDGTYGIEEPAFRRMSFGKSLDDIGDRAKKFVQHPIDTINEFLVGPADNGTDIKFLEDELSDARYKYEREVRGIANEHDRQFVTVPIFETEPETERKIKVGYKEYERPSYTRLKEAEAKHEKALSERMPSFSFFRSVHNLAKENPIIKRFYDIFVNAGKRQEQLRNRVANNWNEILDLLETQEQIDAFKDIVIQGSINGVYYTRAELTEAGVDTDVIEAVQKMRLMNDYLWSIQNRAHRGLIPGKNMFTRARMGVYGYDAKRNEPAMYDYVEGQNGTDVDRRLKKSVLQTIVEDKFNEDVFITLFKASDNTYHKTREEAETRNKSNGMDEAAAKAGVNVVDLSPRDFNGRSLITQNMETGELTVKLKSVDSNGTVSTNVIAEITLKPSEDVLISYNKPQVHHGHSESMIVGSEEWEKFKKDPHNYIYGVHDEDGNISESDLRIIYRDMYNPETGIYGPTPVYSITYDYVKGDFPYRKGYLPHFFGGYGVYAIAAEQNEDGSFRERVIKLASDDYLQSAIEKAKGINKNGTVFVDKKFNDEGVDVSVTRFLAPNGKLGGKKKQDGVEGILEVFVKPQDFSMQDDKNLDECNLDEWQFRKTVEAASQISGGDFDTIQERLKPILQSKKFHHRFNSHEYEQKGDWGWNTDVFDIMPKYINQATRYAAMEPAKFEAISEFEKVFGEGTFEKEAPVNAPLRRWIKRYIRYNNGTPMELERKLNQFIADSEWLSKFCTKWLNASYKDRVPLLIGTKINSIVAPAMLGCFSVSSALVNLSQLKNAYVKIGYKGLEKGVLAVKYMKEQQFKISKLEKSIKDKRKEYSKLMREYNNLKRSMLQYQGGLMSSATFSSYKEWQSKLPKIQKELDGIKNAIKPTLDEISKLKSDRQYIDYLRILHETGTDTRIGLASPSGYTRGWTAKKKLQGKKLDWDAVKYYLRKASDKGMVFFQGTEEFTRSVATLGAYLQARETPEIMGRPDFYRKAAVDFAKNVDIFANFDYGAADAPGLFSVFSGTGFGEVATLFQKYPIKESEIMLQALPMFGKNKMTTTEKIRYWSTYMMLCGMFAFPLFDWFENLINEISGVRIFSKAKARILQTFGENPFTYAICYGVPGALGTDISRRVSLANMAPDHDSLWGYLTGVPGSAALNIANSIFSGDVIGAIKAYAPALGHATEAYYGARYDRKHRMAYRYSDGERAFKVFGFRPTGESVQRDLLTEERNQTNRKQIERQSLKSHLAKKFSAGDQITESDRQEMRNLKLKWKDVVEEYKKQLHTKMELQKKNRRV